MIDEIVNMASGFFMGKLWKLLFLGAIVGGVGFGGYSQIKVWSLEKQLLGCENERNSSREKEALCRSLNQMGSIQLEQAEEACRRLLEYERNRPIAPIHDDTKDVDTDFLESIFGRRLLDPKSSQTGPPVAPTAPGPNSATKPPRKN